MHYVPSKLTMPDINTGNLTCCTYVVRQEYCYLGIHVPLSCNSVSQMFWEILLWFFFPRMFSNIFRPTRYPALPFLSQMVMVRRAYIGCYSSLSQHSMIWHSMVMCPTIQMMVANLKVSCAWKRGFSPNLVKDKRESRGPQSWRFYNVACCLYLVGSAERDLSGLGWLSITNSTNQ